MWEDHQSESLSILNLLDIGIFIGPEEKNLSSAPINYATSSRK